MGNGRNGNRKIEINDINHPVETEIPLPGEQNGAGNKVKE